jgi:hypothetical protein
MISDDPAEVVDGDFYDDDPGYEVEIVAAAAAAEQGRWSRLLWGDRSQRRRSGRGRRDPSLPGMWQVRAMRAGLVGLLAIGAVGGAKALLWPAAGATEAGDVAGGPGDGPGVTEVMPDIEVAGFGELYVAAWLSAGSDAEEVLAPYYPGPVNLTMVEPGAYWASRTATVSVIPEGEGYWSVTVAADVLRAGEEATFQPAGLWFFAFGVVRNSDGFVATTLPSQVPAPATLDLPERVVEDLERPGGELEPVGEALEGFFGALLAGSGDIERYLAPELSLTPIAPAPFAEAEVRSLGARPEAADPSRLLVRAEVAVSDADDRRLVMHYTVMVEQRAGRWEVAGLLPATPLTEDDMGGED